MPDVAGPVQADKEGLGFRQQHLGLAAQFLRCAAEKILHESRDVLATLGQLRNVDSDHVEAVEQVFPEMPLLNQFLQVLVGCRDDTHIDFDRRVAAHPVEFAVGQYAQQAGLGLGRHVTDFIQEQGAPVCLLETALAFTVGTRKGPFLMAK